MSIDKIDRYRAKRKIIYVKYYDTRNCLLEHYDRYWDEFVLFRLTRQNMIIIIAKKETNDWNVQIILNAKFLTLECRQEYFFVKKRVLVVRVKSFLKLFWLINNYVNFQWLTLVFNKRIDSNALTNEKNASNSSNSFDFFKNLIIQRRQITVD